MMMKTVAFKKDSRNVFFHILTQCNLSCSHCYINPKLHGTNQLSFETITIWLTQLYKQNTNLILLGGEPTLRTDLPDIVKYARKIGYSSITIDTNGFLFFDFLSRISNQDIDFISFSLDGSTSDINDHIRGDGTFKQCISGIKNSISKGFNTSLIYTVSNYNINDLKNIPDLLNALKIKRFFIQVIGIRGQMAKQTGSEIQVKYEKWLSIVPNIAKQIADMGITVTYPKVFLEKNEIFSCSGLNADNYFVFPNGRVYRCPLCEDFPLNSLKFENNELIETSKINEKDLFNLNISEGCVMNKLIQPDNITYQSDGLPVNKIACCLLKEEIKVN